MHFIEPRGRKRQVERVLHIACRHARAELPGDDVAGEVIEHGGEIEPAPADHLQIGEVGLPELVGCSRLLLELIGRFHHDEGRAGDQIVGFQKPVNTGLRDEVALLVGERHGQLPGETGPARSSASSSTC